MTRDEIEEKVERVMIQADGCSGDLLRLFSDALEESERRVPEFVFVVMTGSQGQGDHVCRVFLTEEAAQAYAATAREWHARRSERQRLASPPGTAFNTGYDWYARMFGGEHRADLVDMDKAASLTWPFGDDPCVELWDVLRVPYEAR